MLNTIRCVINKSVNKEARQCSHHQTEVSLGEQSFGVRIRIKPWSHPRSSAAMCSPEAVCSSRIKSLLWDG